MLREYRPSIGVDFIILRLHVAGLSSIFGSINILVTCGLTCRLIGGADRIPIIV